MILQDQEAQGLEIWIEGFRRTGEGTFLQEIEDYFIQLGRPEAGLALMRRVAATSKHAATAKFCLGQMRYRREIWTTLDLFQEVRSQVTARSSSHGQDPQPLRPPDAALNDTASCCGTWGPQAAFRVPSAGTRPRTTTAARAAAAEHKLLPLHESDLPDGPIRGESGS
jgi:hypothetical protein